MSIKKILGYALLCAGLFALWGCSENSTTSNDPDGGETGEVTKTMTGGWKASGSMLQTGKMISRGRLSLRKTAKVRMTVAN